MFSALGRLAARRPWYVVAAWLIVLVLISLFHPSVKATTEQSDFLPHHYESIQATELLKKAFPQAAQSAGATIVFDHADGSPLSKPDVAKVEQIASQLKLGTTYSQVETNAQTGQTAQLPPDGKNRAAIVSLDLANGVTGEKQSDLDSVKSLRDQLKTLTHGTGLHTGVTGSLAQSYDQTQSGNNAEAIIGIATIGLIILLLSLIFRSGAVTALPVYLIGVFLTPISNGVIDFAAKLFNLQTSDSTTVILIVVLFGVGTDYVLFFLFRYRERMREGADHLDAVEYAVQRAGEAIVSAGGAVFVAFMTLILSSLGLFKSIGPSLAIAVGVTLIAAITLVPAVIAIVGPTIFWPSKDWREMKSHFEGAHGRSRVVSIVFFVLFFFPYIILAAIIGGVIWAVRWVGAAVGLIDRAGATKDPDAKGAFGRMGDSLGKHPVRYAVATGGTLVILAVFALSFHPTFDLGAASSSANVESATASKTMEAKGFSAGATQPTPVVFHATKPLTQADAAAFGHQLEGVHGVAQVTGAVVAPKDPKTAIVMTVLTADPSSQKAIDIVKGDLRPAAHHAAAAAGATAYVGGTASVFVDFQAAMNRDYAVVFPIAAAIILIILMLVLRSLVAPWYLMVSVGLGFAATLGATTIVFQMIKGDNGIVFLLPIYIYLFVVALGTDYNILMITRLREETREGKSPREAAAWAVRHAGPTIAAAGLILAGTFGSLMLAGQDLLTTMGFAISFGIVVSAFVMSMFFTPALTALIGHAAWWPGHGDEKKADPEDERELTHV